MSREFEWELETERIPAGGLATACPEASHHIVRGFPRYQNTVGTLPITEKQKLRAIAARIRRSFQPGCRPILAVRLVGHADRDVQRGPAFELRISVERARAVEAALKKLVGASPIASRIAWEPHGAGATSLTAPNPRSEPERARNRRVEIELSAGAPIPTGWATPPIRTLDKFESGQARLRPFHIPLIAQAARHVYASWRKGTPVRAIRVVGHTDNTGQASYNAALGNNRATAAQKTLVIAIDRLWAGLSKRIRFVRQSLGSTQPTASNRTAHDRATNRRVEIFFPTEQTRPLQKLRTVAGASALAQRAPVRNIYREQDPEWLMAMPSVRPKVVFMPGIMGSILTDPTVPTAGKSGRGSTAAFCTANVLKSPRFLGFIAGVTAFLGPIFGPPAAAIIANWLRNADMHVLWGAYDMIPWMFIPDQWCARLLQVNGVRNPGPVQATGVTTIGDRYGRFLGDLSSCTDHRVFPYDWRLSMDETARLLEDKFTSDWWWKDRTPEEKSAIPPDEKVTIIAHSMGGLVARSFIESRKGHRFVKQLITVGTPHDGAPETYTHFNRVTLPLPFELPFAGFVGIPVLASFFSGLLAGIPGIATTVLPPGVLGRLLMPADIQWELVRSLAGIIQLLPNSPFVRLGGSLEPIASSYAAMEHLRTGTPVLGTPSAPGIIDLLRGSLLSPTSLDSWLGSIGVTYHTLACDNIRTITGFDAAGPGTVTKAIPRCETGTTTSGAFRDGSARTDIKGDKTVPLASAQLTPGTNIKAPSPFKGAEHGKLLQDLAVRNACFSLIGCPTVSKEMEEESMEIEPIVIGAYHSHTERELAVAGAERW